MTSTQAPRDPRESELRATDAIITDSFRQDQNARRQRHFKILRNTSKLDMGLELSGPHRVAHEDVKSA